MTDLDENLLWRFSISNYALEPVSQACLSLQDNYGARVNILLWCLWMSSLKIEVSLEQIDDLKFDSEHFQQKLLEPMRALRRSLKGQAGTYEQAKSIELELEKLEQRQFWLLSQPWLNTSKVSYESGSALASANLRRYAATLSTEQGTAQEMAATLINTLDALVAGVSWTKYQQ